MQNKPLWKILAILIVLLAFVSVSVGCASAATHYVYPGESIQAAVNAADPGDTIIVKDGTYTENVDVNKDHLTIKSENGAEATIVQAADSNDHVFEVTADYVNISGFTVKNGDDALYLASSNYCIIEGNRFIENWNSIYLYLSSHNVFSRNTIVGRVTGGIGTTEIIIVGWEKSHYDNTIDTSNILNDMPVYYYFDEQNKVVEGLDTSYLLLAYCSNIVIRNCNVNSGSGIRLEHSSDNNIYDNTCTSNCAGILCYLGSTENNIHDNVLSSNLYGIALSSGCNSNKVYNNALSLNKWEGISLYRSDGNVIYLNNFINNVDNVDSSASTNTWNSPEEITYTYNGNTYTNYLGNYWDDYLGSDADGDGIGDNPYPIDGDNDNYPLMEKFENYIPTQPPTNQPPTANAHGPYSANINAPIQFYGFGTDPDGDAIIAYAWDFDNDEITDSTLQNPTHSWSVAGTYYPTLKVQDEKGAWSSPGKCTVLITTPPSYDGDLTGVYSQSHYSTGETVNIGVDIKNTGNTAETYDLHLVVHDKHGASVYDFGSVVSSDDLGEFSATAYHCVYESEMAGTQTVTKTISGTTYTLKASFLFGGYGVAMQGTGRTGPSGDYIHCTNPAELSFVHINNPQEFTDEIRQRYTNLGITDFTGFGNLALTHPEQAEYSVVSGITGASSRTLIPWYSIAVDPSEIPLGTTGTLLFKGGSTTPEGDTQMSFRADDTGGGIVGKHIDIYVGEGQSAIGKWYQTGGNRNVEVHTGDELDIYLSPGAKTTEKFSMAPLPVGQYSFIVYLNSSSSGSVYDYTNGNFRVLNLDALNVIEKDAEPLKAAALDEVDEMVILTSNTMFDMVFSLSWKLVKGTFEGKIKEIIDNFDIFQGVLDQIYTKLGAIIDAFGVEEKLESKLYEAYKGYTASEEIKIIEQDVSFDNFIVDRAFARDDNIIQVFKEGESAISEIMESGEIQKQRDRYEDLERLDESWWTFEIPKIGMVGSAFSMVASLPYTASEVTSKHSSILENVKYFILQQSTSKASIHSVSVDSQTVIGKDTKFSITVDKKPFFQKESFTKEITSEPIIGIVVSPDGRIIDMSLYQTDPYANYETLSSSIRRPHQPGKYKILAMTCSDMASSSVKQAVITQTAPNVSISISTDKQFYNFSETVTINATFINTGPEKIGNLTYGINIQNTTHNKTGFLEIDANSSKVETLVFTPQTNGTYKAIVTLFIELYFADFAETGFTVENGTGVSVNIDSKEVYDPNTNVTASLTIKNVGTELYQGDITVTTVDTLNDYLEVYNSIEPLSVNESEEKELQCIILAKGSSEPGIYRSYIEIDNSTYIVPFTVAANGTIFITVQTDKLIYSDLESAIVNISVKDVAFNATNATLNVTSADPNGNKAYFDVTGSKGNYSTIIPPDNKSVNGTYNILVTGTKEGYRVYSDQTFFIVNERTKLRCDIPRIIQLNTTDTINLFVETDTNQSVKDAFVTLTGCGFNATRTTDENGLVVFGTDSMNRTGVIEVNIEKGGYGSFIGKMEVIGKEENIFDTNAPLNPYPSIMRNHTGTIKPNHTVIATKLYTYSCEGTGGHTEYARIWNKTWNATATWEGYVGDWKNISFDKTVVLLANEEYNYTIRTGSYPQIHHKPALQTANGWINCTEFIDANGKKYDDWVPAIRLE